LFVRLKFLLSLLVCFFTGFTSITANANDAYDPFIDYSEYDDNGDEEADVNFFKNGRQFTLHFVGGYTGLTGNLGSQLYESAVNYGLGLNFFLDLRMAIQLQYLTSNHNLSFKSAGQVIKGSSDFTDISMNLKYYINTQNIIRNLAKLNPYVIIGFAYISRETASTDSGDSLFDKTPGYGANLGGGIEYQLSNKKFYVGAEGVYSLVSFKDEGSEIIPDSTGSATGILPSGDMYRFSLVLGVNF